MDNWYDFFFNRENFESRSDLNYTDTTFKLDKMRALYTLAGQPAKSARLVHIAGTNGKGSTCFFIEQGLLAARARVGLFLSPHVESARERIRIDGEMVSEDEMRWAAEELSAYIPQEATCFETLLLAALLLFDKRACAWIILETGIGGRLDATNIFAPELCVLTQIALDHTALLGTTLPEIAREKAGIIKPSVPVLNAEQEPSAEEVIHARCLEMNAAYHAVGSYRARELGFAGTMLTREYRDDGTEWQTRMSGIGQAGNLELALRALSILNIRITDREIAERLRDRLARETLPARTEYFEDPYGRYLLDGSHNPAALANLAGFISRRRDEGIVQNCVVITAMMGDKDIATNMRILEIFANAIILTTLPLARAASLDELEKHIKRTKRVTRAPSPAEALALAREQIAGSANSLIVIAGSFVLAGHIRGALIQK